MSLTLEVEYLFGVSFAAIGPDSEVPDWPPQPDRIFSALVASWAARGEREEERSALEWLEMLSVPRLFASDAVARTSVVAFVPPNDPRSDKQKNAKGVLPALRSRQPRRFPAARPEDPVIRLCWPDAEPDETMLRKECRELLTRDTEASSAGHCERIDLLAGLMSDAAIKDDKTELVDPTPLCLLFGQGHQHFLERLASVPREASPPPRGRGKSTVTLSASQCLAEALFQPWRRDDPTFSFRWDPAEDVRYSLMAGDPTDAAYKARTQHGANRLAAVGLAVLTLIPEMRAGRVRPAVIGGMSGVDGFSFAFPIWRDAATLTAVRALLSHPDLRKPEGLKHLGVDHVVVAQRISVGKFMNFARARPI